METVVSLRELHPGQKRLRRVCDRHLYTTAVLGRRWGKTYFGIDRLFNRAIEWTQPWRYQAMWVSPVFDLGAVAWAEWHEMIPPSIFKSNKTEKTVELTTNGSLIFFRSADNPDSLISRGLDDVVIDEAARVSSDAVERALMPALADRGGRALAITTPLGRRNWSYRWFQRGLDPLKKSYGCLQGPSTENPNPRIQQWVKENTPPEMGGSGHIPYDIFRQEILAEFLEDKAAVFKSIQQCINPDIQTDLLQSWGTTQPNVLGVDFAKHQDYTVVSGFKDYDDRPSLVGWDRWHRIAWPEQVRRLKEIDDALEEAIWFIDATGVGDKLFDDMVEMGLTVSPVRFTADKKQKLVQKASADIENEAVWYPEIPVMISEMEQFSYEILPSGSFRYGPPDETLHDDCVISFCLGVWGMRSFTRAGDLRFIGALDGSN